MVRSLAQALESRPLFFEPVPPPTRSASTRGAERVDRVAEVVRSVDRLDALNIPELVDENHDGRPFFRSLDPRRFGLEIARVAPVELVVNKVVAHLANPALEAWGRETVAGGIHHAVLVGGSSRYIPYPGPSVPEADRLLRPVFASPEGSLGNIAIPQRDGEANRMRTKARAGASFFTTQLLFDEGAITDLLRRYDKLGRESEEAPAPVLLSFAPLADDQDAAFVRWLGADLPEAAEQSILGGDDEGATARSRTLALAVWRSVTAQARAENWRVPLGINVEQVSARHLTAAADLLRAFAAELGPR